MNIYIVYLKNGRKFCVESYEQYEKVFNRYLRIYGDELASVVKDYIYNSIEEIIKGGCKNE